MTDQDQENERLEGLGGPKTFTDLVEPIWERQPGETIKQFQAYLNYRDYTPPYARTIKDAWRRYRGITDETKNMPGSFAQMAQHKQWVKRTSAYESYLSRQRRERWEHEVDSARERVYAQAQKIADQVEVRLGVLAERVASGEEKLPLSLLMSWWEKAAEAQLKVVGYVPPQKVEADVNVAGPGGVPLDFVIRPQLSDEDLFAQAQAALEAEQALQEQAEQTNGDRQNGTVPGGADGQTE